MALYSTADAAEKAGIQAKDRVQAASTFTRVARRLNLTPAEERQGRSGSPTKYWTDEVIAAVAANYTPCRKKTFAPVEGVAVDKKITPATAAADQKTPDKILDNDNTNRGVTQQLRNLPAEIIPLKRFFALDDKKDLETKKGWNNPANQKSAAEIPSRKKFIGFDIAGHGQREDYALIDFDHVRNPSTGEILYPEAEQWLNYIQAITDNCYCEISQSGEGFHFLFRPTEGKIAAFGRVELVFDKARKAKIEVFYKQKSRCVMLTGNFYQCKAGAHIPADVAADEVLTNLLAAIKPPEIKTAEPDTRRADLPADIKALAESIKAITPEQLMAKGYLMRSEKGAPYPTGFICPWCGSGTHIHKTGALTFYDTPNAHFACHACSNGGDVINFLSKIYGIDNHGKEFFSLIRKAADDFALPYDPTIFERKQPARDSVAAVFADNDDLRGKLNEWQKINGAIAPDVLPAIKAAVEYVSGLAIDNIRFADAYDVVCRQKIALLDFYQPVLARKFFSILGAAKTSAQATIKELKYRKPPVEPDERLQELAKLKISDIEADVTELVTKVKRNHKNYLVEKHADELNDQLREESERRNLMTTITEIPDCPIALKIPDGCYFSDSQGIRRADFDKPPNRYGGRPVIDVSDTPIVPTAIYREPGKHTTSYEVAIKARGIWRRVKVDGRVLFDPRRVLELTDNGGALIRSAQHLCKFFSQIIGLNQHILPEIKCYAQPGWKDKTFSSFAYPTGGEGYIVRRTGFDFEGEFGTAGDADEWKKYFLDACQHGGAPARIFLGTSLAAPLIRPLVVLNSQCHLDGRNNNGKTALNKLGASIYGNPLKLIRTFAATQKNLQSVAAACRDLPAFIDELETANNKMLDDLPTMVYDFAQGKTNQANKRNGDMREALEFSGTRLTTAERPLLKKQDQRGAFKRLVQIHCDTLFDEDFGTDLHYVTENNYGHFGRPWVEFVTEHLKEIKATYRDLFKRAVAKKFLVEKTLLKSVVAASVALQYFLICVGAKETFDDTTAAKDIAAIIATLPTPADMDESTRALDDLRGRFAEKIKYFTREGDNSPGDVAEYWDSGGDKPSVTYDTYGKIFKNGEVAILSTVLRRWIETDLGYASLEPIAADWAKKGLLIASKSKGAGIRYKTRINGDSQWTYKFNANVLRESDETSI